MAPHGSLTVAQEAIGARRIRPDRTTLMISLALVVVGILALSFECVGAALVFFGLCGLLLKLASDAAQPAGTP